MTKQNACTTSTTRSSIRKFTRKQHYARFLRDKCFYAGYQCGYSKLPRKLKKRWKRWAERTFYYDKFRGVCVFNPKLLSTPIPQGILRMFSEQIHIHSGETMTFRRYNTIDTGQS